jgi:hypothetical protein
LPFDLNLPEVPFNINNFSLDCFNITTKYPWKKTSLEIIDQPFHFAYEKGEAQRGEATHPRLSSKLTAE